MKWQGRTNQTNSGREERAHLGTGRTIRRLYLGALLTSVLVALVKAPLVLAEPCERLVSLAPSITETVYELGLGSKLIGVSLYSDYPEAARTLPRLGGLLDPNFELILRLRPTQVLALSEFRDRLQYLRQLGLETTTFDHRHISGILASIETLGNLCSVGQAARNLKSHLQEEGEKLRRLYAARTPVRVMIVVGETSADGKMRSFYLSGNDGYYGDLLALVGGKNVVDSVTLASPTVSAEGVIALQPEVILHILYPDKDAEHRRNDVLQLWSKLDSVPAVRNQRVFVFDQDFASVPGPRYLQLARLFAEAIHGKES